MTMTQLSTIAAGPTSKDGCSPASPRKLRSRKILVVDDVSADRKYLVTTLSCAGYQLIEACDGEEALAKARAEHPDLIITDILMPAMDGYEFVRELRADPAIAQTPVIFHSATYRLNEARPLAEACGVSRILEKPAERDEIFAVVAEALRRPVMHFSPLAQQFDREHLRLLTNKLLENSEEKRRAAEALVERACIASLTADVGLALTRSSVLGEEMLQICAEAMVRHLDVAFVRIWTLNEIESVLEIKASAGKYAHRDGSQCRVPVGQSNVGMVAQERRPHVTNSLSGDPRFAGEDWARRKGLSAFAGYPLLVEERLVGVAAVFARSPFTELAVEAISAVADMLAVGIDRVRTEHSLREREEQFRQLAENISEVFWITNPDLSEMLYVSPAYEKVWGRSCQSLYANPSTFLEAIEPEDRGAAKELIQKHLGSDEFDHEYRIRRPDGSLRWIWNHGFPVRDAQGRIYRACGLARDITERKQTEERLKFTQFSIDHVATAVMWTDADGRFFNVNDAACRLTGYSREELLSRSVPEIDSNMPREQWAAIWDELRRRGVLSLESVLIRKDGTECPVSISSNLLKADGREFSCAFVQDIREQRLLRDQQRALAAERDSILQRLQLQIQRMPLAYMLLDADLRVIEWNPTAEKIFGYSKEEVLGMGPPFEKIVPRAFWPEAEGILARFRTGDMAAHSTNDNLTKDGRTITCEWINTPLVKDDRFEGVMCLAQDVSERRRLEAQFRQAQKMEAVGRLAGGVAHDFNNLMTVVTGYSEFALKSVPDDSPLRRDIEEIKKAGQRAAVLTRQLLAFSRKQVQSPELLKLSDVVANIKNMLCHLIGENIELVTAATPALRSVKADPGQIEQVIMNLAVNARDAMPNGGKLVIETANIDLDHTFCAQCPELSPGPYVLFSVSDTGTGMDAATQARIFEPFFTTKEHGKGTGLGLSMVYGVVQQSGGAIRVYSALGRGTTFKILLPESRDDREKQPIPEAQSPQTGFETILLVEDEDMVRTLTRRILEAHGYRVLEARDGSEALDLAERHAEPLDLVLTDVIMPKMSGKELAQRLKQKQPGLKVLFMSGYTENFVSHQGILDADVALIEKPFVEATLLDRIRVILDASPGQSSIRPTTAVSPETDSHKTSLASNGRSQS
jgi:two-component system cell cycle sensor histidine kinase/response regulator CckA